MKLRLRENSIRLRLLQSEMKTLGETGFVSETIVFSERQKLIYTVKISENASRIFARFENEEITVEIPVQTALDWIETNLVGLEHEQDIDEAAKLKILIEKDFVCVDRPSDADNADAFPHPKMNC
jgi:hypothetical protein